MRLLVVGGTGTIGVEVVRLLEARHDVVVASRTSALRVDIRDSASIDQLILTVGPIDGVVSCAGSTKFGTLDELSTEDIAESLANKLIGQIALARASVPAIRDRGVIVLSSGLLSVSPIIGSTAKSVANAGVEAFVRAVALELPEEFGPSPSVRDGLEILRQIRFRIHALSPQLVRSRSRIWRRSREP